MITAIFLSYFLETDQIVLEKIEQTAPRRIRAIYTTHELATVRLNGSGFYLVMYDEQ